MKRRDIWLVSGTLVLGAVGIAFPRLWVAGALAVVFTTILTHGRTRLIAALAGVLVAIAFGRFAFTVAPAHFDGPEIEKNALDHLREIYWAESQAHRFKLVDDAGQYLAFPELLGEQRQRLRGRPPLLKPGLYTTVDAARGLYESDGYLFVVYLPGKDGQPTVQPRDADPVASSRSFAAYAWPADSKRGGHRAYYVDQYEQICETDNAEGLIGREKVPEPSAYSLNATSGVSHCGRDDDDGTWHPWAQRHKSTPWSKESVKEKEPRAER